MADRIPQDPWDAAFAAYNQAMIDLDGDGVPDVVRMPQGNIMSVPPPVATGQDRRQIQRRAMAGLEPTEQQNALLRAVMPQLEENTARLGNFGMELTGIPQVGRAGQAIGQAYSDPSLGNVANAGLQSALAAVPVMPFKYAAPVIGTSFGVSMGGGPAEAQTGGVEQRLRQMPPNELMAYQRSIGVAPDGRIGPNTIAAAQRYEAQIGESSRIEAQGKADAAREAARIKAETDAAIARQKAESELKATEAQRPFLQRFPEYSNIAPWAAGAASAAVPLVGSLLSRRAAVAPQRQYAQSVDAAVNSFNRAPSPLAARTVAEAGAAVPNKAVSPSNSLLDYASLGFGASLPSAAAIAPYFVDYMQPAGSQAREQAAQEFTVPKMVERMTGPFALGLTLAGGGKFLGDKAGQAFINPAPRGANAAQAQAITGMVKNAGADDTALADSLMNSFRGGQTSILESKRMQGAAAANPPYVRINDIEISNVPTRIGPPSRRRVGREANGERPPPEPPAGGPAPGQGGGQGTQQNQKPNPDRGQGTRSSVTLSDSQRLDVQADLLSGRTVEDVAKQYGASTASIASIQRKTQELVKSAGGDSAEALRRLQTYRSVRDYSYAIPAAIGAGAAAGEPVNYLLQQYRGG